MVCHGGSRGYGIMEFSGKARGLTVGISARQHYSQGLIRTLVAIATRRHYSQRIGEGTAPHIP